MSNTIWVANIPEDSAASWTIEYLSNFQLDYKLSEILKFSYLFRFLILGLNL